MSLPLATPNITKKINTFYNKSDTFRVKSKTFRDGLSTDPNLGIGASSHGFRFVRQSHIRPAAI